jgi:hypothetical protein
VFACLHLGSIRFHIYLFYQKHLTERPLAKFHNWYKVDGPHLFIFLARPAPPSPLQLVIILPYLYELLLPLLPATFLLLFLLTLLRVDPSISRLLLLQLHPLDDSLDPAILLTQILVHVLIRVHESLHCVYSIVVPEDSVHGGATVTRGGGGVLVGALGAGDQGIEELADSHVLRDV